MYTVKSVFTQVTDPKSVFQNIMDTLRTVDPSFEDEHRQYIHSVDILMDFFMRRGQLYGHGVHRCQRKCILF